MIPDDPQERDTYILDAVNAGEAAYAWAPISHTAGGHTIGLWVFSDALMVPNGDGPMVRVGMGAALSQQIADTLDALLLTSQIADLIFIQRSRTATPHTYPYETIGETSTMVACSAAIDADLAPQAGTGLGAPTGSLDPVGTLASTVGKHWILSRKATSARAVNYGWHVARGVWSADGTTETWQGIKVYPCASLLKATDGTVPRVIQPPSTAHGYDQADNSQTLVLVKRDCIVDAEDADLVDVLADPELCGLVSCEGTLAARLPC